MPKINLKEKKRVKKPVNWDDHTDQSPVSWDDLVNYLTKKYPNPLNNCLSERIKKLEKKQKVQSEVIDFITECLDKKYGTERERYMEFKRKDGRCTICPPHAKENQPRYGKHSNNGQKQKKSTPRYKRVK